MKVSKLRIEVQLGPHYPKFEADFRQFYLKTILSLNRMMESFKIRLKGGRKHYFEDIQRPVTRFCA